MVDLFKSVKVKEWFRLKGRENLANALLNFYDCTDRPMGMYLIGSGIITDANHSFLHILGLTLDELRSRYYIDFVHEEDRSRTMEVVNTILKGGVFLNGFKKRWVVNGKTFYMTWNLVTIGGVTTFDVEIVSQLE